MNEVERYSFCGVEVETLPGVFRPRGETENIMNKLFENFPIEHSVYCLDLCAGTGAMGLALCSKYNVTNIVFVESSENAVANIRRNISQLNVPHGIVHGTAEDFAMHYRAPFNIIVSNPPCLPDNLKTVVDMEALESTESYFSGPTGKEVLMALKQLFENNLLPGGVMAFQCLLDHEIEEWVESEWLGHSRIVYAENGVLIQKEKV